MIVLPPSEGDEGREHGERDGKKYRHGGPHAAEKDEDHEPGQDQPDRALVDQVFDRGADEDRLVEDHLGDQFFRNVDQVRDGFLDAIDDRDRIGVPALLEDRKINRGLAVDPHNVGLDRRRILDLADIPEQDRGIADGLDRELVHIGDMVDLRVRVEIVIVGADFNVAGRKDEIGLVHRPDDVHHAQLVGFELERVDINHDLPVTAAKGLRDRGAGHIGHLVAHIVLPEVAQLGLGEGPRP